MQFIHWKGVILILNASDSNFIKKYKVENIENKNIEIIKKIDQKNKMEEIINIIEMNPNVLEKLNIEKLKIIDNYYQEKINEYNIKIKNKYL